MSDDDRAYLTRIHELRCVVHLHIFGIDRKAVEAHHLESIRGEHSTYAVAPLCDECHSLLHQMHRRGFYNQFKLDDVKLLAWTAQELWIDTRRGYV